ncbi:MAG: glycoside hydrolase family 20 zincin-like fold domain-containing protein [Verrucomicrobiota bacterium]
MSKQDILSLILLPCPRSLKRLRGTFTLPERLTLQFDRSLSPEVAAAIARRLQSVAREIGVELLSEGRALRAPNFPPTIRASWNSALRNDVEEYTLTINPRGVLIEYHEVLGLRAATATLRQLLRQYGRCLPCLKIRDWPDFPRRGVMLDVSRGRVPRLETLLGLVEHLADFKVNELQLYTEHTFAYRKFKSVWQSWGALSGDEIRQLDARCRELGIDLVPNQNSFGHLRYFLGHPRLKKLAEVSMPYEDASGEFVRRPSTLAPDHPGTLPFLRGLYDELLPNFSSQFFNVGCDETFDLGLGRSKKLCERIGKGRVYLDFLKKIHHEVSRRGKRMMFWGDIILKYPKLIPELASFGVPPSGGLRSKSSKPPEGGTPNLIALNWGYEADHPFEKEAAQFAKAKVPFYVCPGTSTWQTLVGRHDNALANLRTAARAGKKFGAVGYLITDWGDGGHPQPLAVSYLPYLAGASLSWCEKTFDERLLVPVLSRDLFHDSTGRMAKAAFALGHAHRKLGYTEPNLTPLGAVIAAPPPETRELFCRNGLKYHARISEKNVRATLKEIEKQRTLLRRVKPSSRNAGILLCELDLAARMAAQSCQFMLWQQVRAAEKNSEAKRLARTGIRALRKLDKKFNAYWPLRNKTTPQHCSAFLKWRMRDYSKPDARAG